VFARSRHFKSLPKILRTADLASSENAATKLLLEGWIKPQESNLESEVSL
jgi:hypothetical protein